MSGRILIIGGGFSGTMVAAHLAQRGLASVVVDDRQRPARGVAYSTDDPLHRLNVGAGRMSAWPDRPDDFAEWLVREGRDAPQGFATRRAYGDYLASVFEDATRTGLAERRQGRVKAVERGKDGWTATLVNGERIEGRALVLALGNPPPDRHPVLSLVASEDRIDQPWLRTELARLRTAAAQGEPVLIVGTSLTMVDVALSLAGMGHPGPVIAVSRRGLVPCAHASTPLGPHHAPPVEQVSTRLSLATRWLRSRAAAAGDWREAMEDVRSVTSAWWRRLDIANRRRFLRHARPWWDVHRHRLAPFVADEIDALRRSGWLRVVAGRIAAVTPSAHGYGVAIDLRGGGSDEIDVGLLVDATGPGRILDVAPLPGMVADGLATPDPLGLGLCVDEDGRVTGAATAYAIGMLARGERWETTAVPDLRHQAQQVAAAIAHDLATARSPT